MFTNALQEMTKSEVTKNAKKKQAECRCMYWIHPAQDMSGSCEEDKGSSYRCEITSARVTAASRKLRCVYFVKTRAEYGAVTAPST